MEVNTLITYLITGSSLAFSLLGVWLDKRSVPSLVNENKLALFENKTFDPCISAKERKIRRTWFISYIVFFTFTLLDGFLAGLLKYAYTGNGFLVDSTVILLATVSSLLIFIPAWITYYCSYRKKGTAWLSWILFSASLRLLYDMIQDLKNFYTDGPEVFTITFSSIAYSVGGFYLVNCWRLRRINSEAKARSQLTSALTPST